MTILDNFKRVLRDQLHFPPWLVLVAGGLVLHLLVNWALGKNWWSAWGLSGPFVFGFCLETIEVWQVYAARGLYAEGNDPLAVIIFRHSIDVLILLSAPVLLLAAHRLADN